jgi:RHS repeat-associated protein
MAPPDKWNGYKYSAKELETALNLGVYDFGRRMYDPVAPRFWTPDRFAEKYPWLSPYNYAANNPVLYIDPTGDTITLSNIFMENKQVMKSYNEWATSKAGKQFISDYGAGGKYGKVSVVFDLVDFKDGTSGRTEMFGVDKKTGKETELTPSRTIEELKERGVDVSGYRSSLNKNEYLRAKISVSGNLIDAYSIKQGGTMVHETQHVRLMYKNILDVGYIFHSGKDQHWYMKQEDSRWFRERYQYWQEKRPNYTRKEIFPLMNQFEW